MSDLSFYFFHFYATNLIEMLSNFPIYMNCIFCVHMAESLQLQSAILWSYIYICLWHSVNNRPVKRLPYCLCSLVSNPDHTSYYHCWAGCCECATAVQFFKVTELMCLVGSKTDSSGKYYSSPVPPSCTAVNNMPCTIYRLILIHLSLSNWAIWHTVNKKPS